jgi:nucleotide-binding universal stress UspA family protein
MQVYKKILVTIDCSPVDETILRHVSALARQNNAALCLLHVVHSHTLDQDRVLREQAKSCL